MVALIMSIIMNIVGSIILFLLATCFFDLLHYIIHKFSYLQISFFRKWVKLHLVHHHFFSPELHIQINWRKKNLAGHVLLEFGVQMAFILVASLYLPYVIVLGAACIAISLFALVWYWQGEDLHHRAYQSLPAYRGGWLVTRSYHALHHVYPTHFYSSYIKLIDFILGTALPLKDKRIVMTGANGALGKNMHRLLVKEGAQIITFKYGQDYTYDNYDQFIPALVNADILFLCHGTKYEHTEQANCDSFIHLIELYKKMHKKSLIPGEIWAVGSEIECHPCFGIKKLKPYAHSKRRYAAKARTYFYEPDMQYRHLVHAAFISPMGFGLITANVAARWTLFLLKRGFKYVPVSYTGFAYLNYFRFLFVKRSTLKSIGEAQSNRI